MGVGALAGEVVASFALVPIELFHGVSDGAFSGLKLIGAMMGAGFAALLTMKGRQPAERSTVHGSATFASAREIREALVKPEGLIVGRENRKGGQLLRYGGDAHLITIAPTRSGKGVGAIIPNLLTANRSILCIDPKGENARITYAARQKFGPVFVVDPFSITGIKGSSFNPLGQLDPGSPDLAEDVALLADALVYDPPGQVAEAHWNEEAKALIAGFILYEVCSGRNEIPTLAAVRELLTSNVDQFMATLAAMQASDAAGGLIRRAANRHLGKSDREAAGVLSGAQRHTHFLDSVRINQAMNKSDFRFADLKGRTMTVFLVLPPERLDTYSRWLRLLLSQAIHELARSAKRPAAPVLFLLDEFAALGRLEPVERAFGLMAGYGLQLWPILQDLHQLQSIYGKRSGTFLSNAGLTQLFNVSDVETATWASKALGSTTIAYDAQSASRTAHQTRVFGSATNTSATHYARRDLMTPDEITRFGSGLEILLRQGAAPALAAKVRYYDEPEFTGKF